VPRPRYRGVLILAGAGMLTVAVPTSALVGTAVLEQNHSNLDTVAGLENGRLSVTKCLGAAATQAGADCAQVKSSAIVPTSVQAAADDFGEQAGKGCQITGNDTTVKTCSFGDVGSSVRVALVGDSHATNYAPALELMAEANHWRLTTYLHSGCPLTSAGITTVCNAWKDQALVELEKQKYDVVFVAALSQTPWPHGILHSAADLTAHNRDTSAEAYAATWKALQRVGSTVVAFRDSPNPQLAGQPDVPSCVALHGDGSKCDFSEKMSLIDDPVAYAAKITPGVHLIDATSMFCQRGTCPAVIGGLLVYRQAQHITQTYSRSMAPFLDSTIKPIVDAAAAKR
jgi:hypothetical protein